MLFGIQKFKKMLVEPGFVSEKDFQSALKEAKEKNLALEEVLVKKNIISDKELGLLIAEELGCPFVDLRKESISPDVLKIIPELVAKMQQVIVFDKTKEGLKVAMANPRDYKMIKWLEKKTGEKIKVYYATPSSIREALKFYRKEIKEEFNEIIQSQLQKIKAGETGPGVVPVIRMVDSIIQYGYENRASDIHIEPLEKETRIRFRIDGILHNVLSLPKNIHNLIVSRIKVLAKLRTDEHFAAQDGKFVAEFGKEKFDIRVSIVPVTEGEKVVMRLLSERIRRFDLDNLGLLERDLQKIKSAIKKPFGMILATGPTGCGKTTTLYSILKILNKPEVNISTIEDPVEYDIEGVNQIQVNPKTNITFANGLRSIVRQDPDIIMVGEIRDPETASIAINAAMTGHLVLSTMHANTAATNLPRLIDMGIEPFLVASSVNIIIAQRLVRKICTKCRESYEVTKKDLEKFNLSKEMIEKLFRGKEKIRIFRGKGCRACVNTGYFGRTGIFEVLEMKENIQKLIMKKADADQIQKQAIENGMTTMLEDGIEKILLGITTIEEVIRVTKQQ
ncbi:type II/IV secretion system protein [bacterium]|nr:type II/IV secretion system protein [bacterium]